MVFVIMNICENILHIACELGHFDLVKYIITLDIIDINAKTVFIL